MRAVLLLGLLAAGPAAAQGAPDGLYLMTRYWMNSGLETGGFLFAQGQVARDPAGDPAAFDFAAARAADPASVGAVSLAGDTLSVAWGDGSTTASTLEPAGEGCFYWDGGQFCPAGGFAGPTLSGHYEGSIGAAGLQGTIAVARSVTFGPDGRYAMGATSSFASTSDGSTVSGGASGEEKGTYALAGTTLTLTPKGGAPTVVTAFPYGADLATDHPEWIYFGGTMLSRR